MALATHQDAVAEDRMAHLLDDENTAVIEAAVEALLRPAFHGRVPHRVLDERGACGRPHERRGSIPLQPGPAGRRPVPGCAAGRHRQGRGPGSCWPGSELT